MTRTIIIDPVLNGYICEVGCARVVFQDRKQMLTELGKYYENPCETEKRYLKDAVNKPTPCEGPTQCGMDVAANSPVIPVVLPQTTARHPR